MRDQRGRGGKEEVEHAIGQNRRQRGSQWLTDPVEGVGHQELGYPGASEWKRSARGGIARRIGDDHLSGARLKAEVPQPAVERADVRAPVEDRAEPRTDVAMGPADQGAERSYSL